MFSTEPDRHGSAKKRRITRKQSEAEAASKRRKTAARRNTITGKLHFTVTEKYLHLRYFTKPIYDFLSNKLHVGSESEDNSDAIVTHKSQRPSKSHQYNFLVQLGMYKFL